MRDMRVNRIFEGSTEIMHLIIAREAMDQHLHVAGDLMEPDLPLDRKAKALGKAGAFYATWYPKLAVGRGQAPQSYAELRRAGRADAVRRARQPQARPLDVLRAWRAGRPAPRTTEPSWDGSWTSEPSCSPSPRPWSTPRRRLRDHPERAAETQELAEAFCNQAQHRTERLFHELWDNADEPNHRLALDVLKGRHTWLEEGIIDPSVGDGPMVPSAETDLGIAIPIAAATTNGSVS